MFDRPGIDTITDVAWITRDQFVYYLEMAHALTDPTDWPVLRDELHRALATAFGIEPPPESAGPDGRSRASDAIPQLLDEIRHEHDPVTDWQGFREPSGTALTAPSTRPADDRPRREAPRMYGVQLLRHPFQKPRVQPYSAHVFVTSVRSASRSVVP